MNNAEEEVRGHGSATLMMHLLGQCNLRCAHCYMEGAPERTESLSFDSVASAIRESDSLGIGVIYFTGGEPLLYRRLPELLRIAVEETRARIVVCTNGTLLSQQHAQILRDAGASVNVSVDGMEDFHDTFRGLKGAFRKTENGIRRLVQAQVPVTLVTTLTQDNRDGLPAMVEWAANIGIGHVRVQPLLKLGRGTDIADRRLTAEQTDYMFLQLTDLANRYHRRGVKCTLNEVSLRFLQAHPCGAYVCNGSGCHRRVAKEIKKIVIREDGTVLPEVPNLDARFALGNIHEGPLRPMIERYFLSGYDRFDALCRSLYNDIVPTWKSAVVPWDQLVAEHSRSWTGDASDLEKEHECSSCACERFCSKNETSRARSASNVM